MPTVLRAAGLNVEIQDDHFPCDSLDVEWLPVVSRRGWVVLTKDEAIRKNPLEIQAVRESNARLFALTNANMRGEEMAQVFLAHRLNMGRMLKRQKPPFIVAVTRSGLRLAYPSD